MTIVLKRPVVAVAGSSGKTTTKEMIASVLKQRWKIYKSTANRNNRQHIREHIKHIKPYHQAIVLEFGMSAQGHLAQSCKIIKPNMSIITMVGTAHIGNLGGSLSNLIRAKSELIEHMQQTGTLFLNADDRNSKRLRRQNFHGRIVKIGIHNQADYQAKNVTYSQGGMTFQVIINKKTYNFYIPIYGSHNVYNALFAIALTHTLGFKPEVIRAGLRSYHRPSHRLRVYKLKNGIRVIDDTFNANPNSVKAALDVLTSIGNDENIAVLGSMTELGRYSEKGHTAVGKYAAGKNKLSRLYTYGKEAQQISKAAAKAGFPKNRTIHTVKRRTLHRHLKNAFQPGTIILVKGSHSTHMNTTVKFIKSQNT